MRYGSSFPYVMAYLLTTSKVLTTAKTNMAVPHPRCALLTRRVVDVPLNDDRTGSFTPTHQLCTSFNEQRTHQVRAS